MRSQLRVLLATLALGPVVLWGPHLPKLLSDMETFRVSDVEVRGLRFLAEDTVVAWLELGATASVWADPEQWEDRLSAHPLVRTVEVDRRLPNGLRVTIEERRPIALAATPTLEPLDVEGHRLPIDPTRYRLDLPVIAADRLPPEGAALFPEEVRDVAAEVGRLMAFDEEFVRRVSTFEREEDGALLASLVTPDVAFLLPARTPMARLREGEAALSDAISRDPTPGPTVVDLRFADQVVVRRTRK
jgi:hypothetical protein